MKRFVLSFAAVGIFASLVMAQEMGRAPLTETSTSGAGLGRAPLPQPLTPTFTRAGLYGIKASVGWGETSWELDDADGSESGFVPQVSLFYLVTDAVDINLSFLTASGSEDDSEGALTRVALGTRYWTRGANRFTPYLGAGVGIYTPDADAGDSTVDVESAPGFFVEAGVAFLVSDGFCLHADLSHDRLFGSADATINGEDQSLDVSVTSLNLGVVKSF